jgi:hypothetical protein
MARIKAWLVVTRNATRDYIDFVALSDKIERLGGVTGLTDALLPMERLYPQQNGASVVLQLAKQLAEPMPFDLGSEDLTVYRLLAERWKHWKAVREAAERLGIVLLSSYEKSR